MPSSGRRGGQSNIFVGQPHAARAAGTAGGAEGGGLWRVVVRFYGHDSRPLYTDLVPDGCNVLAVQFVEGERHDRPRICANRGAE